MYWITNNNIIFVLFICIFISENALGGSISDGDVLASAQLAVPTQLDFASAVDSVDRTLNNYGNPADVFLKHCTLNISLGQNHWPLLPFLSWSYTANIPLKIGVGIPIKDSFVATTLLMDYLFYGYGNFREEQLHRGIFGGDFLASYKQKLGVSGHWLTTSKFLTKTVRMSASEESAYGLRIGGNLISKYKFVTYIDTHNHEEFKSKRFEFSIIFPDSSLGFVYTDHKRQSHNVMWNLGIVQGGNRQKHFVNKPLSLWWQERTSFTTGRAAGSGYLRWFIDCYPSTKECEIWTRHTVLEYESQIGCEYRFSSKPWVITTQVGIIGSNTISPRDDSQGLVWNEGIFHPTGWGQIGLAISFIRQSRADRQWLYTMGYEQILPGLDDDRITLEDIGGHFVKLGFHQRIEWRCTF